MFSFSGDYEWARWENGADCAECRRENYKTHRPAIGAALYAAHGFIHVEAVCERHAEADGHIVVRFPERSPLPPEFSEH